MSDEITHDEVVEAGRDAFEAQGYTTPAEFYEAVYVPAAKALASGTKARDKVAVHRDHLTSVVWPLVTPPSEIDEKDPDAALQRLLYKYLHSKTWDLTKPLTGKLQQMLAVRDGLVLCRLGGLRGNRVYVTRDPECFRLDVIESRSSEDIARITKLSMFYGGVSKRIPAMAKTIAEAFDTSLRQQVATGRAHIPLLIEQSNGKPDDGKSDE